MRRAPPTAGADTAWEETRGAPAASHAFAVGQTVKFLPNALQSPGLGGPYVVVRQLPDEADGPQYQVRCLDGGQQRVVPETQLRGL